MYPPHLAVPAHRLFPEARRHGRRDYRISERNFSEQDRKVGTKIEGRKDRNDFVSTETKVEKVRWFAQAKDLGEAIFDVRQFNWQRPASGQNARGGFAFLDEGVDPAGHFWN
jgi:hypothetical protein